MMRMFWVFLIILLGINPVFAYDLVLPKEKKSIVNSNYALFVGKAKKSETITINDVKIPIASNGAFAHSVKLKDGENRIALKSNFNTHVYKFYKNKIENQIKLELIEFEQKNFKVTNDNIPLRSTPIDYGMNRLSHLFRGTNLIINGEKGDFYRVLLSKNKIAWIAKSSVEESPSQEFSPSFVTMNSETFKNASVNSIEFTEKLPYTIEETDKEILFKVYNPEVSEKSVYTVNIKRPEKYSYKVSLKDGKYVLKVNELPYCEPNSLEGLNIVIDAGHGGSELGAIGCLGDYEKDINLKIAMALSEILSSTGANIIMTRECDANVSLENRVQLARNNNANIFVSIHLNSIPDIKMDIHKNRGTTVYYYNPNSKNLAKSVSESLVSSIGTKDDGIKTASFAVIRPTDYIGILVETAFMTNPLDSVLYKSDDFAQKSAQGIAEGILNFVNLDKK
jgi:N-acetylmuramoyl-L-alanine amidase